MALTRGGEGGVHGCSVERGCGWHPWGGGWEGWWDSIGPMDTGHWVQLGTLSSLSFCNREWSCMGGLKAAANLGRGVTVAPPPAWRWGMKGSTMDWAMNRAGLGATSLGHWISPYMSTPPRQNQVVRHPWRWRGVQSVGRQDFSGEMELDGETGGRTGRG